MAGTLPLQSSTSVPSDFLNPILNSLENPPPPLTLHISPRYNYSDGGVEIIAWYACPSQAFFSLHIHAPVQPPHHPTFAVARQATLHPDGFLLDLNQGLQDLPAQQPPLLARSALNEAARLCQRFQMAPASTSDNQSNIAVLEQHKIDTIREERLLDASEVCLRRQAAEVSEAQFRAQGFICHPKDGNVFRWEVLLYFDDDDDSQDIAEVGEGSGELKDREVVVQDDDDKNEIDCGEEGQKDDDQIENECDNADQEDCHNNNERGQLVQEDDSSVEKIERGGLRRQLLVLGRDTVELELVYSKEEFGMRAPLVRVVAPFLQSKEMIGGGGGVFIEHFSSVGWTPVYTVAKVCEMVRVHMASADVRVDAECMAGVVNYTEEAAREDIALMEEAFMTTRKMLQRSFTFPRWTFRTNVQDPD